jgi:predicted permease
METVTILIRQIAIMFGLMAVGWILFRTRFLTEQGTKDLSNILIRLVTPAVIIRSFLVGRTAENTSWFLLSFGLSLAAILLSSLLARFVYRSGRPVDRFGLSFANAGFFGIPLVTALLGADHVFLIASFVMMTILSQWTYGVFLFTGDRKIFSPKRLLLNPVVIAFVVSMVVFFGNITLPTILKTPVEMVANLHTPLAMIVLGSYLARGRIAEIFKDASAYPLAALRLVAVPLITIALFMLLPASMDVVRTAVLIPAIAPVGVNVTVFAGLHGQDHGRAVRIVCLSTILSIVTIPLIVLLAQLVW